MAATLPTSLLRRFAFGGLWLGFVVYAFGFAPPDAPDTLTTIARLSSGDWDGLNPLVVALFNLMGIWPMVYGCVLFVDGRGQRVRAWPFAVGAFAVGAFALLPYFALRDRSPVFVGEPSRSLRFWESRSLAVALTLGAIALGGYGVVAGDWGDFVRQWQTSRFIHVMSLDFCILALLFPAAIADDVARRGMVGRPAQFWRAVAWVPLLGPLGYLCARPSLVATAEPAIEPT